MNIRLSIKIHKEGSEALRRGKDREKMMGQWTENLGQGSIEIGV